MGVEERVKQIKKRLAQIKKDEQKKRKQKPLLQAGAILLTEYGTVLVTETYLAGKAIVMDEGRAEVVLTEHQVHDDNTFEKVSHSRRKVRSYANVAKDLTDLQIHIAMLQAEAGKRRDELLKLSSPGDSYEDDRVKIVHVSGRTTKKYKKRVTRRMEFVRRLADVQGQYEEVEGKDFLQVRLV